MNSEKHVVIAIDNNYVQHAAVTIISLLTHASKPGEFIFHIVDNGIASENKEKLKQMVENYKAKLLFLQVSSDLLKDVHVSGHINAVSYVRLFAADFMKLAVNKVLYIDSDTVVKQDAAKIWEIDITDFYVAAVDNSNLKRNRVLQIDDEIKYFNAGVMLINLKKWRNDEVTEKFLDVIQEYGDKLEYHDQDVMNKVFHGCWYPLSPEWNQRSSFFYLSSSQISFTDRELAKAISDPAIIHYTDASKPWHFLNNHPLKKEYEYYLQKTPWPNGRPYEKERIKNILESKKIIIFGAGQLGEILLDRFGQIGFTPAFLVDNNEKKWTELIDRIPIHSPEKLFRENKDQLFVFIASMHYREIIRQLENKGLKSIVHYCVYGFENQMIKQER